MKNCRTENLHQFPTGPWKQIVYEYERNSLKYSRQLLLKKKTGKNMLHDSCYNLQYFVSHDYIFLWFHCRIYTVPYQRIQTSCNNPVQQDNANSREGRTLSLYRQDPQPTLFSMRVHQSSRDGQKQMNGLSISTPWLTTSRVGSRNKKIP